MNMTILFLLENIINLYIAFIEEENILFLKFKYAQN